MRMSLLFRVCLRTQTSAAKSRILVLFGMCFSLSSLLFHYIDKSDGHVGVWNAVFRFGLM